MEIDGYFAETTYPAHFPHAFTPAWIDHVLRHGGHMPRRGARGAFRYLDLGCGNGLQTILMAAGCPEGRFEGTDANGPAMERAQALAEGLGVANVTFRVETFAETLDRAETGVDYLAGLGLLTWVSAENRALIYQIAGRVLAPGGKALFIVPNRTGLWARRDVTPFGNGRPFSVGQLDRYLRENSLEPIGHSAALYAPPSEQRFWLRMSRAAEATGRRLDAQRLAGVIIVEAVKTAYAAPRSGAAVSAKTPLEVLGGIARPTPKPATGRLKLD